MNIWGISMIQLLILIIISFFSCISADESLSKRAQEVLNSAVHRMPSPSVIGKREWDELQLDRLVTILDRTTTAFGRWGLVKLLHPVASKYHLDQRRKIITFLLEHPESMRIFQEQLEQVHRGQESLLAYWDKNDALSQNCEQFYFTAPGLRDLNKSGVALNISAAVELFNSFKYLLTALALSGVATEFSQWIYSDQKDLDLWSGIKSGFEMPLLQHSFKPSQIQKQDSPYIFKDYAKAFGGRGSWYDRYLVLSRGYSLEGLANAPTNTLRFPGPLGVMWGIIGATIPTAIFDYQWGNSIFSAGKRIISINRDINQLQKRVSDVAHCINSIKKLQKLIIAQDDEFSSYFDINDDDVLDLFTNKLASQRFLKKPGYLYSRGHVLAMHQDIKRMKRVLIPLLHSIAFLDAYCSIAQLYKESQKQEVVFSFPEFIESSTPFLKYYDAWLPLLPAQEAVTNNLFLGGDQPGKIIITGPNGGGKSTVLKTEGVIAVLAQGWGIVPAKNVQQVILKSIRTSLAPHEDLSKGLSTFMAEKKVMGQLFDDICNSDANHPMLVLIDEPYKGTVEDETAKRIYQFGKDVAEFPSALVALATHVKKPILLERDTGGIFGNYQVKIREKSLGVFERLFKLEKGPAMWWFEDENQRSRFIDWIG
jgi:hypothetical protein